MIIKLFGGPKGGLKYILENENVKFLTIGKILNADGYYTRLPGTAKDEWYWVNAQLPIGVKFV